MPSAASARLEYSHGPAVADGLGDRVLTADPETGEIVQVLRLPRALSETPGFEFALRERTTRFTTFRQASCVRVYRVERVEPPTGGLALVSQHVEGVRLSDLLHIAHSRGVTIDISTSLAVIRQLLPATTLLHDHAKDIACGLIAPERIIVAPRGRIVVAEQTLGGAIEQMHYGSDRLWTEFRISAAPGSDRVSFSQRTDVMSIGLVALALMLGRPLRQNEFPSHIPQLLDAARERSGAGHERRLSEPLRAWLARTLQLAPGGTSFASAAEAWLALEQVSAVDPLYVSVPIAVEIFLYNCTSARISPPGADGRATDLSSSSPVAATGSVCRDGGGSPADANATGPAGRRDELPEPYAAPMAGVPDTTPAASGRSGDRRPFAEPSFDIAQLFSDAELPRSPAGDGELPLAASPPTRLGDAPDAFGEEVHADPGPMPAAVLQGMDDAPAEPRWKHAMPLNPRSLLRRLGVGAIVVSLVLGGVLANRWLRPAVVTASGMGTLIVETNPAGLQILLDGIEHGSTPSRLSVAAGNHTLEIRDGDTVRVVPFTIAGGAELSHYLEFAAIPEAQPTPIGPARDDVTRPSRAVSSGEPSTPDRQTWGWLAVKAPFAVEVRLGGRLVATTSGQRIRIAEGRHQIEFKNTARGYQAVRVVQVTGGKVTDVILDTEANEP